MKKKNVETTVVSTEVLTKLLELSEAMLRGDYSKRIVTDFKDDLINQLANNLNLHADKLMLNPPQTEGMEKMDISHFIETISSFANHDFSHKLPVSEHGTILDAIAIGINMMGDELEQSTASKDELQKERNRLNEAQAIAKIGNWEYDLVSTELTGSDELYHIYEVKEISVEILTEVFRKKYHPDDLIELLDNIKNAAEKDTGFSYEHRITNNDGSIKYLSGICETMKNEQGITTGVKGTVQDITDHKHAEIALNNSFNMVSEQNKRLLNFSYIVSHNLRSHTGNIKSLVDLLETATSREDKEEFMRQMRKVSGLLNETILNLNEVVSIQNNLNLVVEPLNLHNYVSQAMEVLSEQVSLKKASIQNNVPKDMMVNYNPAYLESIILNFISNGIKYSSSNRQPLVVVNCFKEDGKTVLQITDNGIGLDLTKHGDKLFGMYKTFHGNKDARGIGLFITKNQIDAMGGKVEVESELNKGTSFKIYIK
jgi:signal transduction histidine kinase